MAVLLDTNLLVRLANAADAPHALADQAVAALLLRGEVLHITAQNLVELRAVVTRPTAANGLGLDSAAADTLAADFESEFTLLPETPDIYPAWKSLVSVLQVIGKQVHDARLVAVCHAHGIDQIMTFNVGHFRRLTSSGPTVTVIDPATV